MRVVFIASPLAGDRAKNEAYARAAMLDSIQRGEAPFVPHLLYPTVLNDNDAKHRQLSMRMGIHVLRRCDAIVLYTDLGISSGMQTDVAAARKVGVKVEERTLPSWLSDDQIAAAERIAADPKAIERRDLQFKTKMLSGPNVAEVKTKPKQDDDPEPGPALGSA